MMAAQSLQEQSLDESNLTNDYGQGFVSPFYRTQQNLDNFQLFPRLPTELRLLIWEFARPEGRIIKMRVRRNRNLYSRAPVPNLLHTNQESRKLALKWYELTFEAQIYFDWSVDAIWMKDKDLYCNNGAYVIIKEEDASKVRRCVYEIPYYAPENYPKLIWDLEFYLLYTHNSFPNIKEIMISEEIPASSIEELKESDLVEHSPAYASSILNYGSTIWDYYKFLERKMRAELDEGYIGHFKLFPFPASKVVCVELQRE